MWKHPFFYLEAGNSVAILYVQRTYEVTRFLRIDATGQPRFAAKIRHGLSRLCYGLRRYISGLTLVALRCVPVNHGFAPDIGGRAFFSRLSQRVFKRPFNLLPRPRMPSVCLINHYMLRSVSRTFFTAACQQLAFHANVVLTPICSHLIRLQIRRDWVKTRWSRSRNRFRNLLYDLTSTDCQCDLLTYPFICSLSFYVDN